MMNVQLCSTGLICFYFQHLPFPSFFQGKMNSTFSGDIMFISLNASYHICFINVLRKTMEVARGKI
jgi:hypothetical protein